MTNLDERIPEDPQGQIWDVVVIGTGAGGATAGFNLARRGRSVLFLERGPLEHTRPDVDGSGARPSRRSDKLEPGWWPGRAYERTAHGEVPRRLPIGYGAGGSTALFAMVMDRFRPVDLDPGALVDVPADASLPGSWPISYEELEPYYAEAEALYRVRGTGDPLAPANARLLEPPPRSDTEVTLHEMLDSAGLHPYRMHYARERVADCSGCPKRLCPHECRNDAARICLIPALQQYGAYALPHCNVRRLHTAGRRITQAHCTYNGREVVVRGRVFVLALGAFHTPVLLLRSGDGSSGDGIGNKSGLVGRNLMLHVSDALLVRSDRLGELPNDHLTHGVALNDFYLRDRVKLGNLHAHAFCFPASPNAVAARVAVFHTIVEDFPYVTNRVTPMKDVEDGLVWNYQCTDELRVRSKASYAAFAGALGRAAQVRPAHPPGALNMAHACGTCRFGDDPRTSVLDRGNRIHDFDNAYVVDASWLPSSGGIHPSLTVVANSLRVSDSIA